MKRILSQGHYELRIDLTDFEGNSAFAKYESFDIGGLTEKYILKVTRYSGTAGKTFPAGFSITAFSEFSFRLYSQWVCCTGTVQNALNMRKYDMILRHCLYVNTQKIF